MIESRERILSRETPAVEIPSGAPMTLPAGARVQITQTLGGSFTVYVEGNLFRVPGRDADALGKEPPPQPAQS